MWSNSPRRVTTAVCRGLSPTPYARGRHDGQAGQLACSGPLVGAGPAVVLTMCVSLPSFPCWLHSALLTHEGGSAAIGAALAARDQARWLPHHSSQGRLSSEALQPAGQRPNTAVPLIVKTVSRLRTGSIIIDGEAVACDDNGIPNFDRLRYCHHDDSVLLCAFDLLELDGDDLRREPLVTRKATLASSCPRHRRASCSMSISSTMARPCSRTPASSALKVSSLRGRTRPIAPAGRPTGSSARTQPRLAAGSLPPKR